MSTRRTQGEGSLYKRAGSAIWQMSWIDELGVKRRRSTRVREKAVAQRMLNAVTLEVSQVRAGLLDRAALRRKEVRSQPIEEHLGTYLEVMRSRKLNEHHLKQKGKQLRRFFDQGSIRSLGDLTPDRLEAFLGSLGAEGLSARTQNQHRQQVLAFLNWCKETERIEGHRLGTVPKRDETRDRRHQRRALTEEELGRLLAVARERGREAWYLCAALAGFRKGDLERLRWSDVDFEGRTLLIRGGKGRAEDRVPLRSELAECLRARYEEQQPEAGDRVFRQTVRDLTRQKDFLRAGLAREEVVLGSDGEPVRTGGSSRAKVKTRIVTEDEQGRVLDLHSLRTFFATQIVKAGVAPLLTKKLMRHASIETTESHYLDFSQVDALAALDGVSFGVGAQPAVDCVTNCVTTEVAQESSGATWCQEEAGAEGSIRSAKSILESFKALSRTLQQGSRVERPKGLEPSTFSLGS